jgi:hypothetical protein
VKRLHRVLDKRLVEVEYLAGEDYSMADIINFPWIRNPDRRNIDLADYPNVKRWHDAVAARPAVQRGVEVLSDKKQLGPMTEEEGKSRSGRQNSWRVGHLQWKWRTASMPLLADGPPYQARFDLSKGGWREIWRNRDGSKLPRRKRQGRSCTQTKK